MHRQWLLVGTVVLLAIAAGCTGSGGGDGGGSGTADWCTTGAFQTVAGQQADGTMTVESQGTVERDGREVCRVSYAFEDTDSPYATVDVFFDEAQEHVEFVYYDADGIEVRRLNFGSSTGGDDGSTDGTIDGTDGDSAAGDAADWCPVGQTTSTSDAEAGTGMTFVVEEQFERDGTTLCRASYELSGQDLEYSRIEFVFDEDESYQQLIYYDEDGTVIQDVTIADGS